MPSASAKVDHHGSLESLDPVQRVLSIVDKKTRNLEKRKNKLEGYRADLKDGKDLNADQLLAVKAYEAVCASLEQTREFSGQFAQVVAENSKLVKKQLRKKELEKQQDDLDRMKEILRVQAVLQRMGGPSVRADFLAGENGAVMVTEENLDQLDQIYKLVTPSFDDVSPSLTFDELVDSSAEHMVSLIEGKAKTVTTSTYKDVRKLVQDIANCPYPENPVEEIPNAELIQEETTTDLTNGVETTETGMELTPEVFCEESPAIPMQDEALQSQVPATGASLPSNLPDNALERVTASDIPPPGLVPPSVSPVPQDASPDSITVNMAQLNVNSQPPPAPNVPTPGQSFYSQQPAPTVNLLDLVPVGDFDFLQESQVPEGSNSIIYNDPAVVSVSESLVRLHEQQAQDLLQMPNHTTQTSALTADTNQIQNMPSQTTYNGSTYPGMTNNVVYNQNMASYPNSSNDMNANSPPSQDKMAFTTETSNWVEQEEAKPMTTDDSGWSTVNGDNNGEKWDDCENAINTNWADDYDDKMSNNFNQQSDYDRRNSFHKRGNNSNRGNSSYRGYRGGRGNNYGGYQNGGNSRGGRGGNGAGGGYGNFRNGRMNNNGMGGTGGFRESRGGSRGGNGNGNMRNNGFRGGQGANNRYQGQRSYQ